MANTKKIILVIGATGAQGLPVIDALLEPAADGTPSPYAVRALTRNKTGARAVQLAEKGVELVEGSFDDFAKVEAAFQGVYGAFVNTDGSTVTEEREVFIGMRIYEIAQKIPSLRHYVWSSLDYVLRLGNWDDKYQCHYNNKARVSEYIRADPRKDGVTWSMLSTGPYMEMLNFPIFGPLNKREDGTYVFATPAGQGHIPMISLKDVGFWARYIFDNIETTARKELEVASDVVDWEYLVSTFKAFTGKKAVALYQTGEEWMNNFVNTERPLAAERTQVSNDARSWKENFINCWNVWRDDVTSRDMDTLRKIHPGTRDLLTWMKETNYDGTIGGGLLKGAQDGHGPGLNLEVIKTL
ncbi:NAD-P-binding protein [Trametopsis cervina]|nr:NAD-P-binding protein [Trametopsis cervina]